VLESEKIVGTDLLQNREKRRSLIVLVVVVMRRKFGDLGSAETMVYRMYVVPRTCRSIALSYTSVM
jgi:hypothetical protein